MTVIAIRRKPFEQRGQDLRRLPLTRMDAAVDHDGSLRAAVRRRGIRIADHVAENLPVGERPAHDVRRDVIVQQRQVLVPRVQARIGPESVDGRQRVDRPRNRVAERHEIGAGLRCGVRQHPAGAGRIVRVRDLVIRETTLRLERPGKKHAKREC